MTSMCLCLLGNVHLELGNADDARRVLEESLAIRISLGATHEAAVSRTCLADALCLSGEHERARALYEESLPVFERDNNRWGMVSSLRGLRDAHLCQGNVEGALGGGNESDPCATRQR